MSQIKGKNTKPEEIVRKYLFSRGFRYRKNVAKLPGKPDIVLPKYRTVIFVNGCFWHMHQGCRYFVWPKHNAEFWKEKITDNAEWGSEEKTGTGEAWMACAYCLGMSIKGHAGSDTYGTGFHYQENYRTLLLEN